MSASVNVDKFSQGIYYTYLLSSSMETYIDFENKLQEAIDNDLDEEYIVNLKKETSYFSGLLELALTFSPNPDNEEIQWQKFTFIVFLKITTHFMGFTHQ